MRKHREIKLVTRERRNYLVSQPYKVFYRKFISNRNGKNANTNKKAYLFKFVNIRSE